MTCSDYGVSPDSSAQTVGEYKDLSGLVKQYSFSKFLPLLQLFALGVRSSESFVSSAGKAA